MNKFYGIIVGLFVVSMATGVMVGMGLKRPVAAPEHRGWIESELNLSAEQSAKVKAIWQEFAPDRGAATASGSAAGTSTAPHPMDKRRQYQKDRDDAVVALLTPAQKADYDRVMERYSQQMAEMGKEREAAFAAAVEKTKALLTDEQKVKYEELLKKSPRGGPFGRGGRGATTRRVATTPANG